jgi:hypothetical protein
MTWFPGDDVLAVKVNHRGWNFRRWRERNNSFQLKLYSNRILGSKPLRHRTTLMSVSVTLVRQFYHLGNLSCGRECRKC